MVAVEEPQPIVKVLDADVLLQPRAAKVGRPHPDADPEGRPRGQHGGRGLQQWVLLLLLLPARRHGRRLHPEGGEVPERLALLLQRHDAVFLEWKRWTPVQMSNE